MLSDFTASERGKLRFVCSSAGWLTGSPVSQFPTTPYAEAQVVPGCDTENVSANLNLPATQS
jgi:hypothetical protein